MDLKYRIATIADLPEICGLVRCAVAHMIENGIYQWNENYPKEEDFRDDIEKGQLTVVLAGEKIAAVYALNKECDEQYQNGRWSYRDVPYYIIHRLCVSPDFQNRGIAKEVLKHIEESAVSLGAGAIRLDVFSGNPYALRLYDRCGFVKVGTVNWPSGMFYLMEKGLKG